jgi:hypothetical protein
VHFCERDSSGTTEPPTRTSGAQAVKVMERIARRERPKGAKRLAQRNFASQNSIKNEELKMKNITG